MGYSWQEGVVKQAAAPLASGLSIVAIGDLHSLVSRKKKFNEEYF
jgi:hypothetical protein